jgi:hypothetical protein
MIAMILPYYLFHYNLLKTAVCNHLYTKQAMELTMHFCQIDDLVGQLQSDTLKFPDVLINWVTLSSLPSGIMLTMQNAKSIPHRQ